MLLVDEVDQKEFLTGLFHAMYEELPMPKQKKKKEVLRRGKGIRLFTYIAEGQINHEATKRDLFVQGHKI